MRTVLVIGAGGIGAPLGLALARAHARGSEPAFRLQLVDDDDVELGNLHRQVLFEEADIGRPKIDVLAARLRAISPSLEVRTTAGRFLPDTALELARGADVIADACDNFPTRFLAADAAHLTRRPVVHAASVRWVATVLASPASLGPCYRCLFEDLPEGPAPDCATAGVVGPVCGVAGAIAADLVIAALSGDPRGTGFVHTYDGKRDRLRRVALRPRADCPLCGPPLITNISAERYAGPVCEQP